MISILSSRMQAISTVGSASSEPSNRSPASLLRSVNTGEAWKATIFTWSDNCLTLACRNVCTPLTANPAQARTKATATDPQANSKIFERMEIDMSAQLQVVLKAHAETISAP